MTALMGEVFECVDLAAQLGIKSIDLGNMVEQEKEAEAEELQCRGVHAQIEYLLTRVSVESLTHQLKELAKDPAFILDNQIKKENPNAF